MQPLKSETVEMNPFFNYRLPIWSKIKRLLGVMLMVLVFQPSPLALAQPDENLLTPNRLQTKLDDSTEPFKNWKYHPGDGIEWAKPAFDDSNWETVENTLLEAEIPQSGFSGIGWFRRHLAVDSSLWGVPLVLGYGQFGAAEIYLDGKLLWLMSRPSAEAVYLRRVLR